MIYKYTKYVYSILIVVMFLFMESVNRIEFGSIELLFLLAIPITLIFVLSNNLSLSDREMMGTWKVWLNRAFYMMMIFISAYIMIRNGYSNSSPSGPLIIATIPAMQSMMFFVYMAVISHILIFSNE